MSLFHRLLKILYIIILSYSSSLFISNFFVLLILIIFVFITTILSSLSLSLIIVSSFLSLLLFLLSLLSLLSLLLLLLLIVFLSLAFRMFSLVTSNFSSRWTTYKILLKYSNSKESRFVNFIFLSFARVITSFLFVISMNVLLSLSF